MIERNKHTYADLGVTAETSTFADETHALLHVEPRGESFSSQFERLTTAEERLAVLMGVPVMKRYFLSDAANQQQPNAPAGISFIQQPPLDGSKVAAWIYYVKEADVSTCGDTLVVSRHGYQHLWTMGLSSPEGDSAQQTHALLRRYEQALQPFNANIADNCVRTWFFVRDVDIQYAGMVKARREDFITYGLSPDTHYIASTGIGGVPAEAKAIVQFGAYAILGLQQQQQRYLYARTHLNPTYEYGVTFERGTAITYGDRSHVIISGTASINNKGLVEHEGDIIGQTHRMWDNVSALLAEAQATMDDVMQIIVYLRDIADYDTIRTLFAQRFPDTPLVITLAPVCRPAWLVEMECIAITPNGSDAFRPF